MLSIRRQDLKVAADLSSYEFVDFSMSRDGGGPASFAVDIDGVIAALPKKLAANAAVGGGPGRPASLVDLQRFSYDIRTFRALSG